MQTQTTEVSKFQKFTIQRINRSAIRNAPYNPRRIDEHAKKKLKENLKKRGLLQPVVVNAETGNLVAGHQRLACLDALEGNPNYALDVAVVHLSPKDEREQNVFMNNTSAMGGWDLPLLENLLKDSDFSAVDAGFDPMDIQILFDGKELAPMFAKENQSKLAQEHLEDVQRVGEQAKELSAEKIAEIKKVKKEFRERDNATKNQTEFYTVIVFQSDEQSRKFLRALKLDEDSRYVDGVRLAANLGIQL